MRDFQRAIIARVIGLNLALGSYAVVGGASLAVRGIRETKDLDIVVTPELFRRLSADGWELDSEFREKWKRDRLRRGDIEIYKDIFLNNSRKFADVGALIADADLIDGVPFQSLDNLLACKSDSMREKDSKDVDLIKDYLRSK